MNNLDLIKEFNAVLQRSTKTVDVIVMVAALDEFLKATPGRKNAMPNYASLSPQHRIPVLHLANALLYSGYKPCTLTQDDRNAYHPESYIVRDGNKLEQRDFEIYLDFLESAITHLTKEVMCHE